MKTAREIAQEIMGHGYQMTHAISTFTSRAKWRMKSMEKLPDSPYCSGGQMSHDNHIVVANAAP